LASANTASSCNKGGSNNAATYTQLHPLALATARAHVPVCGDVGMLLLVFKDSTRHVKLVND